MIRRKQNMAPTLLISKSLIVYALKSMNCIREGSKVCLRFKTSPVAEA